MKRAIRRYDQVQVSQGDWELELKGDEILNELRLFFNEQKIQLIVL